jgi:hypothetical protein
MGRTPVMIVTALLLAGAASPLLGQVPGPNQPRTKERRAPGAPSGKTLGARPAPGAPAAPAAAPSAEPTLAQPGAVVTPQAAPARPAPANAFSAGLSLPPFSGSTDAARYEYLGLLAQHLDSATVALVELYRNTSGQPMAGATSPEALSTREHERWARCRNLYWDFSTYRPGLESVSPSIRDATLARAAAALDSALASVDALEECDNVSSMISAPERWDPWAQQYANAARHFYTGWYDQVREAHERVRALVRALNAAHPGQAVAVPPGLPSNPPYAGAAIR